MIKQNVTLNKKSFSTIEGFSSNILEWAKHDINDLAWELRSTALEVNDNKEFPNDSHMGSFDLILASDVIYNAAFLMPLATAIKHFLKPLTGRCLVVSEAMRYDVFSDRFEAHCKELGLKQMHLERVTYKS